MNQQQTESNYRQMHRPSSGKAVATNEFLRQVYAIMSIGLLITGLAAWFLGQKYLDGEWLVLTQSPYIWIIMFAPLGFVLALSFGLEKMSYTVANLVFGAYSLVNGISLAIIFLAYAESTIQQVFFITGATFATMSLIGYTTKVDLTKYRSYFMMALIGLLIAMVVNMFMRSSMFDYIISIVGVLLFCGLTAYDTQKLADFGENADMENESVRKYTVLGALTLYLDFINLFLFLLRILGGGRD